MVERFRPVIDQVYFINEHTLFLIRAGSGTIQIDFQNYADWQDRAIYLSKGQYIRFFSDDFEVMKVIFPDEALFHSPDVRVLFNHLISLGYIDLKDCRECSRFLSDTLFDEKPEGILDISAGQWYWQNPFNANQEEYRIIFDLKDIIDMEYGSIANPQGLAALLDSRGFHANQLVKDKLGLTVSDMLIRKKALEGKRGVAFTDKSVQQVAFDAGFKDPAYFNRAFKRSTGQTPVEFREGFGYPDRDTFVQNIMELLKDFHHKQHKMEFYADKMNMTVQTLSKKVRKKMNSSLGQLIRNELIGSAKEMLREKAPIADVAYRLGFEEPHHFSAFFKHYTGKTPSEFSTGH